MDPSNALMQLDGAPVADEVIAASPQAPEDTRPAAILRGTARGLEVHIKGGASIDAICGAILNRLDEAPTFFRGSDVRIRVEDGPLAAGCLARLDELATRYDLRILEVAAARNPVDSDAVPTPNLAAGSAPSPASVSAAAICGAPPAPPPPSVPAADLEQPIPLAGAELAVPQLDGRVGEPLSFEEPTQTAVPLRLAPIPELELELETISNATRLVIGPVRSGVILEHAGHLIVFGDVNPGAEIRAQGNIVVLGRLRGTAHAGIGQEVGFILSLRLEPQQLRIGRKVARAADSDQPAAEAEIAYCTGDAIVVERYLGKLPKNLASSI